MVERRWRVRLGAAAENRAHPVRRNGLTAPPSIRRRREQRIAGSASWSAGAPAGRRDLIACFVVGDPLIAEYQCPPAFRTYSAPSNSSAWMVASASIRPSCASRPARYWHSEFSDLDFDPLPDDVENEEKYVAIPDKRDLGLGKALVLDFARECLPRDFDEVRFTFSKKGAYPRFRVLPARRGAVDRWHDFEAKATEKALRAWCALNSIELAD